MLRQKHWSVQYDPAPAFQTRGAMQWNAGFPALERRLALAESAFGRRLRKAPLRLWQPEAQPRLLDGSSRCSVSSLAWPVAENVFMEGVGAAYI